MITGIKKKNKLTEIWFDETGSAVNIRTYNTDLKKRLTAYAVKYPAHCRLTDDDECGCLTFEIDRRRFSVRLTAPYKPTSPYLKEDLRKLDELSQQVRYMSKYGIETFDDLYADREKIRQDMDALITRRTKLQNRIRRAAPAEKETLRQEKAGVTEQITTLRKQLKLNKAIEVRSAKIQEKTDLLYANEYRAKEAQPQKKAQRRERDPR